MTIKEVLMHMIDTERGFSYRVLVCARADDKTLCIQWMKICMLQTHYNIKGARDLFEFRVGLGYKF